MARTAILTARYPFPWDLFVALTRDLSGGRRSLAADARLMVSRIEPPPRVENIEHLPARGPVMVAANHYQRRGLWIAWPGSVITVVMAERRGLDPAIHWLTIGGLRFLQPWDRGSEIPLSGRLLKAVADTYCMTALPLSGPRERSAALRRWARHLDEGGALGVFPEGQMGSSRVLRQAAPGFSALCRLIARRATVIPAGISEVQGTLTVRFGPAISFSPSRDPGVTVMESIAALVPAHMRGPFGRGANGSLE